MSLEWTKGVCASTAWKGYDVTLCVDADGKTKIVRSDGTVEQMRGLTDPAVNGVVFRSAPDTTRPATGNDLPGFSAAGPNHSGGAVPDPGANVGTTKFLREDATWAQPPSGVGQALSSGIWRPVFPEAAAANASYASRRGRRKSHVICRV